MKRRIIVICNKKKHEENMKRRGGKCVFCQLLVKLSKGILISPMVRWQRSFLFLFCLGKICFRLAKCRGCLLLVCSITAHL